VDVLHVHVGYSWWQGTGATTKSPSYESDPRRRLSPWLRSSGGSSSPASSERTGAGALLLGGLIAAISSIVGVFTVLRGHRRWPCTHRCVDAGGSGALLIGMAPVAGFVVGGVVVLVRWKRSVCDGLVDEIWRPGSARRSYRSGGTLPLLDSTTSATTGASQQILFGSIFVVASSTIPYVIVFGAITLGLICLLYRPLLLSSLSNDIARARGIRFASSERCTCWRSRSQSGWHRS